jgi:glycolate oxidase
MSERLRLETATGVATRLTRAERLAIAADLRRVIVDGEVLSDPADLETFAYDASFLTQLAPVVPDVAVVARSQADVAAVMRYARANGIPVTPRGAASGAGGGCVALRGGIILAMNAMDAILEIDTANGQAIVEPGVVHARLNDALAPHGLVFPPDPGSSRMATIGGMASTNAHGVRAVKYGPTASWVLGLHVVLPDGTVIETGSAGSRAKQSASGYELTKLFVGAEGTLGVITRLRLKVMPQPKARAMVMALFDLLEKAGEAVQSVLRAGISPSAIEILDARSLRAANLYRPTLGLPEAEAMLLFEVDGNPASVRWDAEQVTEAVRHLAAAVEWSDQEARIARLWEARSVVGAAVGALRPGSTRAYAGEDICVPVNRIPEVLRAIQNLSDQFDVPVATYGHIGGGSLHPAVLVDGRDPDNVCRVVELTDAIHKLALDVGGTVTGEHGVGAARAPYMPREHGPALEAMRAIKRALDPTGIMNPATIFPEDVPPTPALDSSLVRRSARR